MKPAQRPYLTNCLRCGWQTSRAYAKKHNGWCKRCAEGGDCQTRQSRILDCGWDAYAREEGHYDCGDR